jgi:hypothetical protein
LDEDCVKTGAYFGFAKVKTEMIKAKTKNKSNNKILGTMEASVPPRTKMSI